ncbi:NEP1-interacting protein 1-like [Zingiber officinale]|uniref:NEP1-interacting protein 1-like n=1 Tax=Zingiber officinale TaxID=94328 RepID=UPI001C4AD9FB|nr:NEP1-interacting protein 1-like [Zingiber officinale]
MRPSPPTAAFPVEDIVPVDLPPWIAISGGVELRVMQQAWERETQVMLARVAANYVRCADLKLLAEAFRDYTSFAVRQLPMMSAVMTEIYSIIFVPNASSSSDDRNNVHFDRGSRPASTTAVEGLNMVTAEEPDSCSICLQDFGTTTRVLAMPCGHLFHAACLKKWLERSCSCPLCRFSLPQEE